MSVGAGGRIRAPSGDGAEGLEAPHGDPALRFAVRKPVSAPEWGPRTCPFPHYLDFFTGTVFTGGAFWITGFGVAARLSACFTGRLLPMLCHLPLTMSASSALRSRFAWSFMSRMEARLLSIRAR